MPLDRTRETVCGLSSNSSSDTPPGAGYCAGEIRTTSLASQILDKSAVRVTTGSTAGGVSDCDDIRLKRIKRLREHESGSSSSGPGRGVVDVGSSEEGGESGEERDFSVAAKMRRMADHEDRLEMF